MEKEEETFLSQIVAAQKDMEDWPQWMRDATRIYAAVVPEVGGREEKQKSGQHIHHGHQDPD